MELDKDLDVSHTTNSKSNERTTKPVDDDESSSNSSDSDISAARAQAILEVWKETVESSKTSKADHVSSRSTSFSENDSDDPPPRPGDISTELNENNRDGGKVPKRVWGWFATKKAAQGASEAEKESKPTDSDVTKTLGQTQKTDVKINNAGIAASDCTMQRNDQFESVTAAESNEMETNHKAVDKSTELQSDVAAISTGKDGTSVHLEAANAEVNDKIPEDLGQKKDRTWWFGKKSSFGEIVDEPKAPPSDPLQQKKEISEADSNHSKSSLERSSNHSKASLERSSNHSVESVTEPLLDSLMRLEDSERATKVSDVNAGSNVSPPKRKKKKKSADISTLIEGGISTRKVSRHGDEVSVGTMNVKKRQNGRAVVISRSHDDFDESDEFGPKSRPWESTLRKIPKRSLKLKQSRPKPPPVDEFNSFPSELEDLLKVDLFGNSDDFLHQGKASTNNTNNHLPSLHEDDESEEQETSDVPQDDDANDEPEAQSGDDLKDIDNLLEMNDLGTQLDEADQEIHQALDFDDMWDNVSCDASIAIEFERVKRKKNHEKEKKRQRREQEKDEKINSAQRLRVFDRRKEKEMSFINEGLAKKTTDKQSKLSDALVDAIHKVFDDGSVNSAASSLDQSKDEADRLDDRSANGSCNSLYLPGDEESEKSHNDNESNEDSVGSGNDVSKRGSKSKKYANDDASDDGMNTVQGSRIHEGKKRPKSKKHGQGTKSTINHKGKKAKKVMKRSEIDSSEIFLAEVERLNRPKVLTIAALKQEMIDRRGTSVNLVKKEYVNYRKKRNDRRKGSNDNELKPIDFGALSEQLKKKQEDTNNDIFGKTIANDSRDDSESTSKQHQRGGLSAKLSRWKATEGITDLDDLATVVDVPTPNTSLLSTAAAFAKTTMSQLPDVPTPSMNDIQGIARDAGKTLTTVGTTALTVGHSVGGTAVAVAGRTVGTGLSHGAQAVNTGIQSTTQVFGKGLTTVANGMTTTLVSSGFAEVPSEALTVGSSQSFPAAEGNQSKESDHDNFMFAASFSDIHLSTIQEGDDNDDDDDDHGLLARHRNRTATHDTNSFDGGSFYDSHDGDDDSRGSGFRDNKRNFKMNMIKAPKMNLSTSIKRLVPKLPKRKGNSDGNNHNNNNNTNSSRGGFLMGGGGGNNGYGGM